MSVFGFAFGTPFGSDVSAAPVVVVSSESLVSALLPTEQNFGEDVLVFGDLDSSMTPVSDGRVYGEALGKRFTTRRGTLPFHDDYGIDVRDWLNETMSADLLFRMKAEMEAEALKDERTLASDVRLNWDPKAEALTAIIEAETTSGPYSLTLRVTDLSVELLAGG